MIKGKTPFITSIDNNNGFTAFVDYPPIHKGNTLSVNRNGSVGEAFYQDQPFCSTEDVHIFNPKFSMTKNIGLFIATILRQEKYRYGYGRKWGIGRMNNTLIKLPSTNKGDIDWEFIENYIKSLNINPIKTKNLSKEQPVNPQEWKEFKLNNIFDIYLAKAYHKVNLDVYEEEIKDSIVYISRTGENNGLSCFVIKEPNMRIEKPNAITVGAEGIVYFYQNEEFICGNKVSVLRNSKLNKYNALFLTSVFNFDLKKRYNYGRALIYRKVIEEQVFLPSTDLGNPDWQYMEDYIKGLPFADKI